MNFSLDKNLTIQRKKIINNLSPPQSELHNLNLLIESKRTFKDLKIKEEKTNISQLRYLTDNSQDATQPSNNRTDSFQLEIHQIPTKIYDDSDSDYPDEEIPGEWDNPGGLKGQLPLGFDHDGTLPNHMTYKCSTKIGSSENLDESVHGIPIPDSQYSFKAIGNLSQHSDNNSSRYDEVQTFAFSEVSSLTNLFAMRDLSNINNAEDIESEIGSELENENRFYNPDLYYSRNYYWDLNEGTINSETFYQSAPKGNHHTEFFRNADVMRLRQNR